MLPTQIKLEIVTPEKKILSEMVDEVVLPGREGYLGVLPGHTPLLTLLKIGRVEYRIGKETHYVALAWGFAEILPDAVTVLAQRARDEADLPVEWAQKTQSDIEKQLEAPGGEFDYAKALEQLEMAKVVLEVAKASKQRLPGEPTRRGPKAGRVPSAHPGD